MVRRSLLVTALSLGFATTALADVLTDLADLQASTESVTLAPAYKQTLLQIVDSATLRYQQGRPDATKSLLRSYVNYVNRYVAAGELSPAEGQMLTDKASAIIAQL